MIKIFHLSDIHIHNLKFHQEYHQVFEKFFFLIKQEKPDVVVIGGDLADKKTQLSPEYFDLCSWFLKNIADLSKLIIIPGNHDGIISNESRLDAITPVVNALSHKNIIYLKRSGEHKFNDDVVFNHLSIFDRNGWKNPSDPTKINIALYHGSISGCKLDNGWQLDNGDDELSIFQSHDFAMLGDIHLANQVLDQQGRVRYPGSFIQQNFGEMNNKGFLIWEIKDKNKFNVKHIIIPHPKPFITIQADKEIPQELSIPEGSRVRVITGAELSFVSSKEIVDLIKSQFNVESVSVVDGKHISRQINKEFTFKSEDLFKTKQDILFLEYLKANNIPETQIQKVLELDKQISSQINEYRYKEDIVQFEILDLEWSNFFQFGENNYINFQDKIGTIGIFGENQSGKSSIIDTLIYTIYGDVSKKIKKNVFVINHNADFCLGKVRIKVENNIYTISRRTQKVKKKLKGEEVIDAQVQVEFISYNVLTGETISLNGEGTQETNKNIRNTFGDIDYLLLTSISSQFGSFQFIDERSTNRKELLGKLLKLDVFGKKYDIANKKAKELKVLLKKYDNTDFESQIIEQNEHLTKTEKVILEIEQQQKDVLNKEVLLLDKKTQLKLQIINISGSVFQTNISSLNELYEKQHGLTNKINFHFTKAKEIECQIKNLKEKLLLLPQEDKLQKNFNESFTKLSKLDKEKKLLENEIKTLSQKVQLLKQVPCGEQFPNCKFIKDAFEASGKIGQKTFELKEITTQWEKQVEEDQLNRKTLNEFQLLNKDFQQKTKIFQENGSILEQVKTSFKSLEEEINVILSRKEEYEKIQQLKEQNNKIVAEVDKIDQNIQQLSFTKEKLVKDLLVYSRNIGSFEEKITNFKKEQQSFLLLKEEFELYEKYLECVHPSGIVYLLIKQTLPLINKEINSLLSNVVNFSVELANEDDRLEVYVKKPNMKPTLIEGCSGAERTIASLGIRLALLFISSIPRSDKFILDEPALWLDKNNFEGFLNLLEVIKVYFNNIIIITHLEALKEVADVVLNVSIEDQRSKVW